MGLGALPRATIGTEAKAYYQGEKSTQVALARRVAKATLEQPEPDFYRSGMSRFDGQSAIAIYQMTLLGLGQVVSAHPELRDEFLPAMRRAAERLVAPQTLTYAAKVYGQHGVRYMAPGAGHAYLGYINLGLGMLRKFDPETPLAALHDRLTRDLAARLFASPTGLIETYPGETWPPDVAAVAGSIGLHDWAVGRPQRAAMGKWSQRFRECALDPTGYLVQRLVSGGCKRKDAPRGSGTAVSSYFLSFATPELSSELFRGLAADGRRSFLGFGAVKEYASGYSGSGDGNAGPIVLGVSVGASGFALGAARAHGAEEMFIEGYRTAALFGIPTETSSGVRHAVAGALGDALLLAMLTALPAEIYR
ncbi:MAG: hypothetical protein H6718_24705 [Polyangiaceae bacterium]|nr:hypothetical protein [Myxococcales bacterium]MCB9588634.1 hypothetical protein [Polyangiaceae bacterium]